MRHDVCFAGLSSHDVSHFVEHVPVSVAPCVHHADDRHERFAEFRQKIFRFHRNGVVYHAPYDSDGFQFAELLHEYAPRRPFYRTLELHGAVDAFGHAVDQIGFPFRAYDILRDRHAAVRVYRRNLVFVHIPLSLILCKDMQIQGMRKESYRDKFITYCSYIASYLILPVLKPRM